MSTSNNPFGPVIYSYSRAQAIADGVLVDLSKVETMGKAFKFPVACTDVLFNYIQSAILDHGKDIEGICHDLATLAILAVRRSSDTDTVFFKAVIGTRTHSLKMHIGPGDTEAPVMTMMLSSES